MKRLEWHYARTLQGHFIVSVVRSKLDYRCIIYGSVRKSYTYECSIPFKIMLFDCVSVLLGPPASSLWVEANEPPLQLRRKKLNLQYTLKLSANQSINPAHKTVFNSIQLQNVIWSQIKSNLFCDTTQVKTGT